MKKVFLLSFGLVSCISVFSQNKDHKKEFTIVVDSADAVSFLTLIQVGLNNLMTTSIPANQIQSIATYGQGLFQKDAAIYQSWLPKVEATKKDSTSKKP